MKTLLGLFAVAIVIAAISDVSSDHSSSSADQCPETPPNIRN
jgi:hypothetical protein